MKLSPKCLLLLFCLSWLAALAGASPLVISEFRANGTNGAYDEFIEFCNNSDSEFTVNTTDGSEGFALVCSNGERLFTIPNGTHIPAHGHFLATNYVAYSLDGFSASATRGATGDITYTSDIPVNAGLALFNSSSYSQFNLANRLDAVGSVSVSDPLYREGPGLPNIQPFSIEHSFVRNVQPDGLLRDSGDNTADFVYVDTNGTFCGAGQNLGAPCPENLDSPVFGTLPANSDRMALDVSLADTKRSPLAEPNMIRSSTSDPSQNSTFGTVCIRRKFTNVTTAPITRLRFRITDISTFPAPSGAADFRPRSSSASSFISSSGQLVTVAGSTLDTPPAQVNGGGINSCYRVDAVSPSSPLAPGQSICVQFLLGIQQQGTERLSFDVPIFFDSTPPQTPYPYRFSNNSTINVQDDASVLPYPSQIQVSGIDKVASLTVTLRGIEHSWPADLDVLLVGPGGQRVMLMSDTGGNKALRKSTVILDDDAPTSIANPLRSLATHRYKPTNADCLDDDFSPSLIDQPPASTLHDAFYGTPASGTWSLYVRDDRYGGGGSIDGWELCISPMSTFENPTPIGFSYGPSQLSTGTPYPSNIPVAGIQGRLTNVSVTLANATHTFTSDLDLLLVGPAGQQVIIMSDAGSGYDLLNYTLTLDDNAAQVLPQTQPIYPGSYRPANYEINDTFPAPAPALDGVPGSSLSIFRGSTPNGVWKLYAVDDMAGDSGTFQGGWSLNFFTGDCGSNQPPTVSAPESPLNVNEDTNVLVPGVQIADPDAGSGNLRFSVSARLGRVNLPVTTGLNLVSGQNNSTSMTLTGTLANINTALRQMTYHGLLYTWGDDELIIQVDDQGNAGNGGAQTASNAVPITILPSHTADLYLSLSASPNPVYVGSELSYTMQVFNAGPDPAASTLAAQYFINDFPVTSWTVSQGLASLNTSNKSVEWYLNTLPPNTTATMTVKVTPTTTMPLYCTSNVSLLDFDPNLSNNNATLVTNVKLPFGLERDDHFTTRCEDPTYQTGWSAFGQNAYGLAQSGWTSASGGAFGAKIFADPTRFRTSGYIANQPEWLPYSQVGKDNYVRAKYYVWAQGQSGTQTNQIPNVRLRLQTRYAVNSMLEVLHHSNGDPGAATYSAEFRPSKDASRPSLYRVDFDPVDVPYLESNGSFEGIQRGFEAYSTDPQDNGSICVGESVIGTYPAWLLSTNLAIPTGTKIYATSASDAGDLKAFNSATDISIKNLVLSADAGVNASTTTSLPFATHTESAQGVTLDSSQVPPAPICALLSREFYPGANPAQAIRVEPGRQYKIRWHITSTQQSNQNAQLRLRARTCKFAWTQKYEIGGAWATGGTTLNANNTIAQQALPGEGCMNPDHNTGESQGGWYTMLFNTPLSADIRADMPSLSLSQTMPKLMSCPGPGSSSTANAYRDLKLGCDLVDTLSGGANANLERGNFTITRIDVQTYNLVDDGGY